MLIHMNISSKIYITVKLHKECRKTHSKYAYKTLSKSIFLDNGTELKNILII